MARKYVPNGKPNGGKRDGAGRKPGSKSPLAYGETQAIKAAGLRVPESATQEERELADEMLDIITEVARGKTSFKQAPHRYKAAAHIREEICGPLKQKVEHSFEGVTDEQLQARFEALVAKGAEQVPQEAGPTESAVPTEGADPGLEGDS